MGPVGQPVGKAQLLAVIILPLLKNALVIQKKALGGMFYYRWMCFIVLILDCLM